MSFVDALRSLFRRRAPGDWHDAPDDPLPVILAHFADLQPGADRATLDRVAARLFPAFEAAAGARRPDGSRAAGTRPERPTPRWHPRPATAFALALTLVFASAVAAIESGPGEPFYGLRLALEAVTLPAAGSPARALADLDRASARLAEAERAAGRGDEAATEAALAAYDDVLAGLTVPVDRETAGTFEAALAGQLRRVERLKATVGPGARAELETGAARLAHLEAALQAGPAGSPAPSPAASGPANASPAPISPAGGSGPGATPSPGGPAGSGPNGSSTMPTPSGSANVPGGSGGPAGAPNGSPAPGQGGPSASPAGGTSGGATTPGPTGSTGGPNPSGGR